ncbi:MAG: RNA polymerase sigma factor [Planctomycetota bacterium]
MQVADAQIVERCLDGDQQAYAELMDRYKDRCYWTAWKFVKNAEDAADVVQEAFVKAFNTLERFDRTRAFFTWLYRIVVNLSIDHIRKRDARPAVALEDVGDFLADPDTDDPADMAELGETQRDVYRAMDMLPEAYRTVLVLSEIEGFSCKEVGEILDIPHATARWRLHHARKLFKDVWERRILKLGQEA